MQIMVLIGLALILVLPESEMSRFAPWPVVLAAVGIYWGITAGASWLTSLRSLRLLEHSDRPIQNIVRRHRRIQMLVQAWILVGLAGVLLGGAVEQIRQVWWLWHVPAAAEAALGAVFFVACVLYWRMGYAFERALRWHIEQELMQAGQPVRAGWTARQHVSFNLRHNFFFVAAPLGLIVLVRDVLDLVVWRWFSPETQPWANMGLLLAAVGVIYFISPMMLVRIWRTRSMPRGELRTRLEKLCELIPLRYRDILVWDTGGVIVNAGVMGLHRSVRYVLVSDALLEQMEDRQIVAVFGHEAGHVVHHHMGYFLLFAAGSMMASIAIVELAVDVFGLPNVTADVLMMVMLLLAWGFGFGRLSRQFERQADVFGAWCLGLDAMAYQYEQEKDFGSDLEAGAPWFMTALEKVGRLNGLPRDGRNWRHGSISTRVNFLSNWTRRGLSREEFDWRIKRMKLGVWVLLAAGAAALGALLAWQEIRA